MKFVFIVNSKAGNYSALETVVNGLNSVEKEFKYEIYITKSGGDATTYVRDYMKREGGFETCFVSCGGDGTLNEVGNGLIGFPKAYLACLPCGSGNDFIKYYCRPQDLLDINKVITGTPHKIDVLKVNDRYCFNVCHFGFDSIVAEAANRIKLKDGKHPYERGVFEGVLRGRFNKIKVVADGIELTKKRMLLGSLGNGRYVGSMYMSNPHAINDDGLIDVCVVHPTTLMTFWRIFHSMQTEQCLMTRKMPTSAYA